MKAKTYRNSDFLGPQNLSSFGIGIATNLSLGLEEFNFIDVLNEKRYAFIPAFSTRIRQDLDFLELFYYDRQNKTNVKYAELRGVEQISNEEVESIRELLGDSFLQQIIENPRWGKVFGEFSQNAIERWKKYYYTNTVFPKKGDELRFVLNTKYDSINFDFEIQSNNIVNCNFAKNLYF